MTPRSALWAPATTPIDRDASRRYLRLRPFTLALSLLATLAVLLWLATRSAPQLAIGVAVWAAIAVDAVAARRAMRDVDVAFSANVLFSTADPLTCTVQVTGATRPVVLSPTTRPNVQRFLIDVREPGVPNPGVIVLAPRRRGLVHTLMVDAVISGPIGLIDCGKRFRIPLAASATIGPAPLPHDVKWPLPRSISFGLSDASSIGDDLYRTLRPYVRGDSRRRVHWKASAHHGALMVKESDGTGVASVRVIVQLDGPGAAAEAAVSRAAWVASEAVARGWWTELVTTQPRLTPASPPVPLGSPFGRPPLDVAPALGPTHVLTRRVAAARDVLSTLATACYGSTDQSPGHGRTYLVTSGGDRWL